MSAPWNVFSLGAGQFETLLLVLVRTSAMLSLVPIFSQKQLPRLLRVGIALILSFVIARTLTPVAPLDLGGLTVAIVAQVFIGITFGFVAYLIFMGIQFAGEIVDTQIGFAVANIINPQSGQNVTIIGEFQLALGTLLYLATDSHHLLIAGIAHSFSLVPLPFSAVPDVVAGDVVRFFTQALFIVFQIAAPVAVVLFVVNVMLALMTRVAPQMNVFVVGFPLQITAGLVMLIVTIPLFGAIFPSLVEQSFRQTDTVMRALAPPPVARPPGTP